ncbi:hypothetical protein [Urechidicola croceus]|uniref:Lipoprotein n=1 Tax=Urechidicola croceus TaxID=1850246 RepID=A0A1D8P449_9FLAO|nr:hypothetical protein [Urechidicola croceus]AOW19317.1 hypothetical protein LPB138_00865 [Urechidicola croceus]
MKNIIPVIILFALIGCNNSQTGLAEKIDLLKKQNDSLTKIIDDLNEKYIFDEIKADFTPSNKNKYKIGEEYNGKFFLIGHNNLDYVLFSTKLEEGSANLYRPDTLRSKSASYKFSRILDNKENNFFFKVYLGNEYGQNGDYIPLLKMSQQAE